jgi:hypothetical protein
VTLAPPTEPDQNATTPATGRTGPHARVCVVDGWRALPVNRTQVCVPCEGSLARRLRVLEMSLPVLRLLPRVEPGRGGQLNLGPVDMTLPAHTGVPLGLGEDQCGVPPLATVLGRWWEDVTGHEAGVAGPAFMIQRLLRVLPWMCAELPSIADFAADVRDLFAQSRRHLSRDLRARRYSAPCPSCGQQTLRQPAGADWVACTPCDWAWDEADYGDLTADAMEEVPAGTMLRGFEIALVLGLSAKTVSAWVSRGSLKACREDRNGKPLYLVADARAAHLNARLFAATAGALIIHRTDSDEPDEPVFVRSGHTVTIAGCEIVMRRCAIVTVGPIGPDDDYHISPPTPKEPKPCRDSSPRTATNSTPNPAKRSPRRSPTPSTRASAGASPEPATANASS